MNVVVVESPAKAKTINKYLGSDYRSWPATAMSATCRPRTARSTRTRTSPWSGRSTPRRRSGSRNRRGRQGRPTSILATDPDREGEAISWHVLEVLKQRRALKDVEVQRVVFNAITKSAVARGDGQPARDRPELVDAYLARRALDYLVGFTLSPVLWRKLPGSRSAGRVQSVALRIVCRPRGRSRPSSRRNTGRSRPIWPPTATGLHRPPGQARRQALEKFDIGNEAAPPPRRRRGAQLQSSAVEKQAGARNPPPPFTTSTLQQEASRKLGFSAQRTMQAAQKLYEGVDIGGETVGLITYMRTDGVQISAPRRSPPPAGLIGSRYGEPTCRSAAPSTRPRRRTPRKRTRPSARPTCSAPRKRSGASKAT
jgi:DNA topoisomerase-1